MSTIARAALVLSAAALLAGLSAAPAAGATEIAAAVPPPQESAPEEAVEEEDCGPVDPGCLMADGVTKFISRFVTSLIGSNLISMGVALTAEPPPTNGAYETWQVALTIANSLFVILVTVGGILVMTHTTLQTSTALKELLPRIIVAFIATNASWFLMREIAELAGAVSHALLVGDGLGVRILASVVVGAMENVIGESIFLVVIAGAMSLVAIGFVFSVVVRTMLWIVLTATAPLALVSLALPQTEGLARLWWRAVVAVLLMQVAQALVLRLAGELFVHRERGGSVLDLEQSYYTGLDQTVLLVLLYVLMAIPKWATSMIFSPPTSGIVKGLKTVAAFLVFRGANKLWSAGKAGGAAAGAARTSGAARGTTGATRSAAPSHRPRSGPGTPRARGKAGPVPRVQHRLPGMDRHIDHRAQARLRERRQYVQPQLGQANGPDRPAGAPTGGRGGRSGSDQQMLPGMPPEQPPLFDRPARTRPRSRPRPRDRPDR